MNVPGQTMIGHMNYKGVNVMKNKKKTAGILLLTCILGAVLLFVPKYIFSAVKTSMDTYNNKKEALKEDHWVYNDSGRKFVYHDGVVIENTWREVDGTRYYFDDEGYVKTGWVTDKGKRYYLKENGTPASGWVQPEGESWYYLDESGAPKTGWVKNDEKWYYLKDDGTMATGWIDVDGKSYYLQDDGSMASGWVERDGNRYYLDSSGTISTGWKEIEDSWYYFRDEDGAMMIGWITSDGTNFLLDSEGKMVTNSWEEKDGKKYYLGDDGKPQTGWVTVDGKRYYLKDDGTLAGKGWIKDDGKWYYLKSDGTAKTGWLQIGKDWYYLNKDGSMATGWITVDGKAYFLKDNGVWDSKAAAKTAAAGSGPMVALTFDDGPGKYTDRILDTLQANGAKATFFMLGQNVPSYPDAVRKMDSMGCELANHTYDHTSLDSLDASGVQNEVESTNSKIAAIVGHGATLVRPPYGAYNSTTKANAGLPMILWSVDTLDWETRNAQSTYDAVMAAKDGDVILMHDIHGPTADAVDMIVPALKAKGFQMVTVSELAAAKGISLGDGIAYGAIR